MGAPRIGRRPLLHGAGVSMAGALLGCSAVELGLVKDPGTRAYPSRPSVNFGEPVTLHISTPAPQFRVEFWRQGAEAELVYTSDWISGVEAPVGQPHIAWDYVAYRFDLPNTARPGVYIARVIEGAADAPLAIVSPAARHDKAVALFVVRTPHPARGGILYKLALATYQAYNYTGGGSLYHTACDSSGRALFDQFQHPLAGSASGTKVTLLRPGGGVGPDTVEPVDVYDRASSRNTFTHWDAHFIRWLERNGYAPDYCVGLDLHQDPSLLSGYSTLICAGHDEYWSEPERNQVESFLARKGNVAFFSGNTCWWRIHYVDDDTAIVCNKRGHIGEDQWYRFRPENRLTGVSYRFGGGRWKGPRPVLGYTVQHPDHWVYERCGVSAGDVFGAQPEQPLVGYECDSAPFARDQLGMAVVRDAARYGTPPAFTILGVATLDYEWKRRQGSSATMGAFSVPAGGQVFNAATTDWVKLLDRDPVVTQITKNVLGRFSEARELTRRSTTHPFDQSAATL